MSAGCLGQRTAMTSKQPDTTGQTVTAAAADTGESDGQQLRGGHRVLPNMGYSV